jgi:uncharacterized RDD family membrane protein YckC
MLRTSVVDAGREPPATVEFVAQRTASKQTSPKDGTYYPGKDIGLPESGPGSVAGLGRRFLALLVDWLLCTLIAYGLFRSQYLTIAVFAVEAYLGAALGGCTIGQRLLGIRVIRVIRRGKPVGFGWAAVRTLLLLCVLPALLAGADQDLRGLHDRAADTIVVRI